jgi:hypothetical protein
MNKSVARGSLIAVAVGVLFLSNNAIAYTTAQSSDQQPKVKCLGANGCSGSSACKSATSPGPGQNSCAGKGFILTSSAKECRDKGGKPE